MRHPAEMLSRFLISLAFVFAFAANAHAAGTLSEEELLEILAKPHQDAPVEDSLRIFPNPGDYKFIGKISFPDGSSGELEGESVFAWVEGKYLVEKGDPPGPIESLHEIVQYDDASEIYRKYQLVDGKLMSVHVGKRIGETRGIAWMDLTHSGGTDTLTTEIYGNGGKTTTVLLYLEGSLLHSQSVVAKLKGP